MVYMRWGTVLHGALLDKSGAIKQGVCLHILACITQKQGTG